MSKGMTWALTDHLCKGCGGRVLRCVSGGGPTGGGNPIWKCADCGKSASAMGPEVLCWCGFSHKHNHNMSAYACQPFTVLETKPELLAAFQACGCDPRRGGEVGIMLERDLHAAVAKPAAVLPPDCRLCGYYTTKSGGCTSIVRCVNGARFKATLPRQYWSTGDNT